MEILQNIDQLMQVIEAIALLVITIAGLVAAVHVKARTTAERVATAAEAAVRYIEQWRLNRLKAGQPDLPAETLRSMAGDVTRQLVHGIPTEQQNLDILLEAAVQQLPKTRPTDRFISPN